MPGKGQGQFEGDAGSSEGIEYWRIENLNPVKQDMEQFGNLYEGDCYIFLHTYQQGSSLQWDLYFWLGKDSSQDEQGGAALRTVELDDQLGGGPVQFREVDGHESNKFLALFPNKSIRTMPGGVDSAFNKVDRDAYEPRLFHVKGKRNVKCSQVEKAASSLNEGDVFILDQGKKIFQWNGAEANKYEKFKGLEMVNKINADERGGKCECVFLESAGGKDDNAEFWAELGGSKGDVKSAEEGGEDKSQAAGVPTLVRISDAGGSMSSTIVAEGHLEHKMLDDTDVFIVDVITDIFVWVGTGASREEKRQGMRFGMDYIKEKGYPGHTNIQKFNAGSETAQFKAKFRGWPVEQAGRNARQADISALYAAKAEQEEKVADLGGFIVNIWRINNMAKEELPKPQWGQFWEGDSFILLYQYKIGMKDAWLIYFWLGRNSSQDEQASAALLAKELDDEMGGDPVQVRVTMGKEPTSFLQLFEGKMIVHQGGVASGFKNRADEDSFDTDGISLFHVRGSNSLNTRAVQVEEVAASLNSGDCFVLLTPDKMVVWQGKGANDQEKATSENIAKIMQGSRGVDVVEEGSEPDLFWDSIGGKGEYSQAKEFGELEADPRLFQMSCNAGAFEIEEIFNYDQSDLCMDDVMMLDVRSEVFLWVGPQAMKAEKDSAMEAALNYVKNAPDGRDPDTPVYRISAGFEPPQFTQHFLGWDVSKASQGEDPYVAELRARGIDVSGGGVVAVSADQIGFAKFVDQGGEPKSLAELQAGTPAGCDPASKEEYLTADEFKSIFGCDRESFRGQAKWKKQAAKKKNKLF